MGVMTRSPNCVPALGGNDSLSVSSGADESLSSVYGSTSWILIIRMPKRDPGPYRQMDLV